MTNDIADWVRKYADIEELRRAIDEDAKGQGLDPAALRHVALWDPAKAAKQQVKAAVYHQYRFKAGQESKAAKIPPGSELAKVAELYAQGMSARDIGAKLGFGKSKAHKLMQQAELFGVTVRVRISADSADADRKLLPPPPEATAQA